MRLRTWLLMGTSASLLAFAPLAPAFAQNASDPALVAAFEAYKADPSDANQQALTEACIVAGFANLDECIAALTGAAVVSEEPPPASSEEAAPPVSSEEAAPPPAEEAPPPPPSSEEAAPPPAEEAVPPPPAEEAAPPASSEEQAPPPADANVDVQAQLQAAVALYNEGVAELTSGNAEGQFKIDQASAQIETICSNAGMPDTTACLANFNLTLDPLPDGSTPPATSEEPPAASEPVDENAVEVLPPDVPAEEAAPILDSQKDEQTLEQEGQATEEAPPAATEPPAPPPSDDKQAQADIQPPPPEAQSTQTEQGQQIDVGSIDLTVPPPEADNVVVVPNQPSNANGGLVVQVNFQLVIVNYYQDRDRYYDPDEDEIYYEQLSRGRIRETVIRPNGVKIVTIRDRHGEVLKRSKILPNGTEIILASYDRENDDDVNLIWTDPGDELPPLRLTISAGDYILDAEEADEDQIELFLDEPPVEQVKRIYSIEEVKRSARIRDMVRRLEVGNLTFDTGSAQIQQDQVGALSKVAKAMQKLLERNPAEVFLIEGHTDAVGSDVSNLALSDLRAATVADILTEFYDIPAENLVTQGYGERYLKVKTEGPEELNRRVTFKRITPLISYSN